MASDRSALSSVYAWEANKTCPCQARDRNRENLCTGCGTGLVAIAGFAAMLWLWPIPFRFKELIADGPDDFIYFERCWEDILAFFMPELNWPSH